MKTEKDNQSDEEMKVEVEALSSWAEDIDAFKREMLSAIRDLAKDLEKMSMEN